MRIVTLLFCALLVSSQSVVTIPAEASWVFRSLSDLSGGAFASAGYDVSDDGSAVVGISTASDNDKAFRWTDEGGMVQLESSTLFSHSSAISSNGSVAVGWVRNEATAEVEAFRWTESSGAVGLDDLPGGTFESFANDVSADGTVVVGLGHTALAQLATRWTQATGQVPLGDLDGGIFQSAAFGVSRDGSTVVGTGHSAQGPEAFLWTEAGGFVGLSDLDDGIFTSHAEDVLADGEVVIGYGNSALGREAMRWTQATGMVGLGDLPGGSYDSWAWGGSADGSLIVGSASTDLGSEAFLWDPLNEMRNLRDVAESEFGLDLTGWTLNRACRPTGEPLLARGTTLTAIRKPG